MKAKKWITWLCAIALLAQAVVVGFPAMAVEAQAAEQEALVMPAGNDVYYYDLANGNYFLSGGSITVNGEVKASGSELSVPGDYTVVKTITDRNGNPVTNTQIVALYQQGDASPDGEYNIKDLVAMKKHLQGIQITKSGAMAIDAYVNKANIGLMHDVLLGNKTAQVAFPKVGRPLSYQVGSDSVMPIGGFLGPGYLNPAVATDIPSGAINDFRTDAIYSLVADAGINLITATTNTTASGESVEKVQQLELALAEKYGISMFVQPSYASQVGTNPEYFEQYLKELSSYDSFAGISLQDEPWTANYHPTNGSYTADKGWSKHQALAQKTNAYGNLTGYTNLLPYWESMGTQDTYRAYLDEYFANYGNPKQIAFDYYVFSDGVNTGGRNASEYFINLKLIKEAADKYDVPFWATVQAGNYVSGNIIRNSKDNAYMTEGMTRWTVHTALAYGAQGITYYPLVQPYTYAKQSGLFSSYNYDRNGIIGADGTTTPYYDQIKNVNQQILAVDQVLMNATNNGLAVTQGTLAESETGATAYGYGSLAWLESSNGDKGAMAGCFDYYGKDAYYVVNYDYNAAQDITLYFKEDCTLSVTINGKTQLAETSEKAYKMNLRAGDAALVLVNGEAAADAQTVSAMLEAIPENAEMPRYYTAVADAQAAYESLDKIGKMGISAELTENLNSLVELAASYGPLTVAEARDADYGLVTEYALTDAASISDSLHKTDIPAQYSEVVFYVYNPGEAVAANYNGIDLTLNAGWTMVTVPVSVYGENDNALTFASPVSGAWKVTRFYGKNDENLKERVQAAIDALPDAATLSLAHEEQVKEARAMYEALSADLQAHVNTAKLIACENKIEALKQEQAGKLPLVIPNTSYGVAESVAVGYNVYNETYEQVMTLADAGYFAIPVSQITESYKNSKSAALYIYNPTEEKVSLDIQLDGSWNNHDRRTLYPQQWTAVELFDKGTVNGEGANFITGEKAIYFYAAFAGEGWMVSGVYGMNSYKADQTVVYDIEANWGLAGTNTDGEIIADEAFGNVFAFSSANEFQLVAANKTDIFRTCNDVVFYIYNPTDTDVQGSMTSAEYWNYKNYVNLKANSWNRIALTNFGITEDAQFVADAYGIYFYLTLPAAADGAKWKITDFYGTPNMDDDGSAAVVDGLINALPAAEEVTEKHFAAIDEAKKAYDALGMQQNFVNADNKAKLDACVAKMEGYMVAFSAVTNTMKKAPDAEFAGDITKAADSDYGPVFAMNITAAANASYIGGFRAENIEFVNYDNLYFHIYNPHEEAQILWLYADNWEQVGTPTLQPGWNKVTVDESANTVDGAIFGMFPASNIAGGTWKISSIYAVSNEIVWAQAAANVEAMITALKDAADLTVDDRAAVDAAQAAYDALNEESKELVSAENKERLDACVARMTEIVKQAAVDIVVANIGTLPATIATDADRILILQLKVAIDAQIAELGTADQEAVKASDSYVRLTELHKAVSDTGYSMIAASGNTEYVTNVGTETGNNGQTESVFMPGWGNVYSLSFNVANTTGSYRLAIPADYDDYDTVSFAVYNPMDTEVPMVTYDMGWTNQKVVHIAAKSWGVIAVDTVYKNGFFVVINTTSASDESWYVTGMLGKSASQESAVGGVNAQIALLPDADVIGRSHTTVVEEAKAAYDALSESEKAKVENKAKLDACVAKLAQWDAYDAKTVISADTTTVAPGADDNTFGTVWTPAAGSECVVISAADDAYIACEAIEFYLYNDSDESVHGFVQDDSTWTNVAVYDLEPNTWTKVTIRQATLESGKNVLAADVKLYVYVVNAQSWKMSGVFSASAEDAEASAISAVEAKITALPEASSIVNVHRTDIAEAKAAFDALSAESQAKVSNAQKLNDCLSKVAYWDEMAAKAVLDGNGAVVMPTPNEDATVIQGMNDNTFGLTNSVIGGEHLFIHNAYLGDAVEFYVYNPTASDVSAYFVIDSNWEVSQPVTLTANAWTCVHVEWAKLVDTKGHMYFYAAMAGGGWKVSNVYQAEVIDVDAEAAASVNAKIAALPEANAITDTHRVAIAEAEAAFDALSDGAKAKVENVQKLNDCTAKVAYWDEMIGKTAIVWDAVVTPAVQNSDTSITPGVTRDVQDNTFGKAIAISNATHLFIHSAFISEADEFYIYNPTSSDVSAYYVVDTNWDVSKSVTLAANSWTCVHMEWQQLVSAAGHIYFYANIGNEGWMITDLYRAEKQDAEAGTIATLNAQIAALPEANAIGGSHAATITEAKAAYDALSAEGQARVEDVDKLNACVAKVASWNKEKTVVDAAYQALGADGTLTVGVDNNLFGSVYTVSGGTYVAVTPNVKTENPAFKQSKNIGFYIYNPTDSDVEGYYTMDWGYNEYFQLKAKSWNYVEFADFGAADNKKMISSDATVYFYIAFTGENWMVSSMYSQDTNVNGLTMVVDASYQTLGTDGALTVGVDNDTFGKVYSVSGGTFVAVTNNVKTEIPAFRESKDIVFYIYNPTDTDVDGYYTMDWGYNEYFQLKANSWNRIVFSDFGAASGKQMISSDATVYFYVNFAGEGWLVSNFYALAEPGVEKDPEAEAIAAVNEQIAALPEANALGGSNTEAVNAAKAAFDALSEDGQASVENVDKLNACVAKVNAWAKLGAKIVVDASYQVLGADGTLTVGVDNNLFGSVYTVSGGTYVAVTPNVKTENPAFKQSKNIGFYIYNPTDSDVEGYYTMDWGYNEYFQLKAKSWNYVEFADYGAEAGRQMISSDATIFFYVAFAGEGWLISSMYSEAMDVAGLTMVVDASYQTLGTDGALTVGVDNDTFGKVYSVSGGTFVAVTNNVKTEIPTFRESKDIVFYIYNPTDTDVDGYYTMDWGYNEYFQLKANSWNRIVFSDFGAASGKQMISSDATVYFYVNFAGEGWLISNFYAVPEY